MMASIRLRFICTAAAAAFLSASFAGAATPALHPATENAGPVPIPPAERGLQTVFADRYFKVSDRGLRLEGAVFDKAGNLRFVDVGGDRVFSLTPNGRLTSFATPVGFAPTGLAVHKDGRLFIAGVGNGNGAGGIIATLGDGSHIAVIVPPLPGHPVDDLAFDAQGGLYFTDISGASNAPTGGVFYVPPDGRAPVPAFPDLALPNGVALSPDDRTLWVDEYGRGTLHRIELAGMAKVAPFGTTIPYHFIGSAPDSIRVDADGNVYVAIYGQARIIVFNPLGLPIGQILMPGRETGHNLYATSMAIRPGTDELYIVVSDHDGGEGAGIYRAKALAKAASSFGAP